MKFKNLAELAALLALLTERLSPNTQVTFIHEVMGSVTLNRVEVGSVQPPDPNAGKPIVCLGQSQ